MAAGWVANIKTIAFVVVTAILAAGGVSARAMENEFVRQPGQYTLDGKGSLLTITKRASGSWSLEIKWRSGDATSSARPDDCLLADGWFVFVKTAHRVWVFDGIANGILLANSDKESSVSALSPDLMSAAPRKFRDALPPAVRAKYQKAEPNPPPTQGQPSGSETNRASAPAGSRR